MWKILENISKLVASLASLPVLARILTPDDFGIMQMGLPITFLLTTFGDFGIGSALICDIGSSRALWASAVWLNLVTGLLLSALMLLISPLLALFYHEPRALPIFEALSALPFLFCANIAPGARLVSEMRFRLLALIETGSTLISVGVVIWCALHGHGAMSLVYQQLTYQALRTSVSWLFARTPIGLQFDWPNVREILPFGFNLLGAQLVNFVGRQADSILVGRFLGAVDLGFYSIAYRIMLVPVQAFGWSVGPVALAGLSRIRDDKLRYRHACLALLQSISFITFPMMAGLSAVADPLVHVLLGERMAPASIILAIVAPVGAIQSVGAIVGQMFVVLGRSDVLLRWTICATTAVVLAFLLGSLWSLRGMASAYLVINVLLFFPGLFIYARIADMPIRLLLAVFLRTTVLSALMGFAISLLRIYLHTLHVAASIELALCVTSGCVIYAALTLFANQAAAKHFTEVVQIFLLNRRAAVTEPPVTP